MMRPQITETDLISLVSIGDREAFSALYSKYLNNIYRYIFSITYNKEVSEEIVQDLFLKVWENRNKLKEVDAIKPYLYRSAKNLLINHIKKSQAEVRKIDHYKIITRSSQETTDDEVRYKEYARIAQYAIELLPEKRKQIFKLHSNDDLSIDEIAAKLSISKSVVKKQWYKGANFVREYLFKYVKTIVLLCVLDVLSKIIR
jgi:RNA polymerase sigma-70 factor (family 1)